MLSVALAMAAKINVAEDLSIAPPSGPRAAPALLADWNLQPCAKCSFSINGKRRRTPRQRLKVANFWIPVFAKMLVEICDELIELGW